MSSEAPYQSRDVQRFERWSRTYEESWMQRRLFSRVHAAVLDLAATASPPAVVLDVGCGTGRLLRAAAARWPEAQLIGVDPAQGMVDVARELTPGATFHRGLAEALPLADASVDLVTSTLSFHHWRDQAAGASSPPPSCASSASSRWSIRSSWRRSRRTRRPSRMCDVGARRRRATAQTLGRPRRRVTERVFDGPRTDDRLVIFLRANCACDRPATLASSAAREAAIFCCKS
jgi:SAM-dependent methyltransferase